MDDNYFRRLSKRQQRRLVDQSVDHDLMEFTDQEIEPTASSNISQVYCVETDVTVETIETENLIFDDEEFDKVAFLENFASSYDDDDIDNDDNNKKHQNL